MNQDITVSGAEVNYRNAELARETAEAAIVRYTVGRRGKEEHPTLRALKAAARNACQRELFLDAVWKQEYATTTPPTPPSQGGENDGARTR